MGSPHYHGHPEVLPAAPCPPPNTQPAPTAPFLPPWHYYKGFFFGGGGTQTHARTPMISWALWGGAAVPDRRLLLPAQLLGGGLCLQKSVLPLAPPCRRHSRGGAALLAAPGDEGTRPCSDSWESRPLHAQAFYGAPPGSPELINPPRKRWYSREKSFWSPAPVCMGVGLGLSPPGGSQRCHRRAVGRCAAGGRRAVPTQPPPARPRSLINLLISSLAGLRAWSPGWEQHRCSTGVLQAAQDGAPPRVSATPYHPRGVWGDLFHS